MKNTFQPIKNTNQKVIAIIKKAYQLKLNFTDEIETIKLIYIDRNHPAYKKCLNKLGMYHLLEKTFKIFPEGILLILKLKVENLNAQWIKAELNSSVDEKKYIEALKIYTTAWINKIKNTSRDQFQVLLWNKSYFLITWLENVGKDVGISFNSLFWTRQPKYSKIIKKKNNLIEILITENILQKNPPYCIDEILFVDPSISTAAHEIFKKDINFQTDCTLSPPETLILKTTLTAINIAFQTIIYSEPNDILIVANNLRDFLQQLLFYDMMRTNIFSLSKTPTPDEIWKKIDNKVIETKMRSEWRYAIYYFLNNKNTTSLQQFSDLLIKAAYDCSRFPHGVQLSKIDANQIVSIHTELVSATKIIYYIYFKDRFNNHHILTMENEKW